MLTATFILFTYTSKIALWVFVVIFSRDLIIVLGWTIIYILTSSSNIDPRLLGKTSTLLQMTSAIALLFPVPDEITRWIVRFMVVLTIISAVDYIWIGSKKLEPIPKQ